MSLDKFKATHFLRWEKVHWRNTRYFLSVELQENAAQASRFLGF